MTRPEQHRAAPPERRRRWGLLVFAVLVGLLAMHALSPGGAGREHPGGHAAGRTAVPPAAAREIGAVREVGAVRGVSAHDDCAGDGGGCGGGHLHHADPTCAAAAVSGTPALPALLRDPVAAPGPADSLRPCAADAPDGARAPPSLAELQLLRI
ncbi:DUF6153 family protein [Streptomyces sp. LUP30]|uniref:DUF6153 family protein n=1 Tax=Streptomyces sp. LUP30 TaxID=1890285 RepID=UPI000AB0A77F|nr:DUF6153 family protein [Streptomyces sp. LUP30]